MALTVNNFIRTFFYLTLTPFHISVTIFIFKMIRKGNKMSMYKSSFFILYLMVSVMDILSVIDNFYCQIEVIDFFKPWLTTNLWQLQISWFFSNYCTCMQSFYHMSIAINRAWVAYFGLKPNPEFTKFGKWTIWLLPFVALPQMPQTFGAHYMYEVIENGVLISYFVETWAQPFWNIVCPIGMFSTAAITFIFATLTIHRYRKLLKTSAPSISVSIIQDMRLFCHALVLLVLQLALVVYYILSQIAANSPFFAKIAVDLFYYISDAYSFCNPIALLCVSKNVRDDYFQFLGIKKQNKLFVAPASLSR